jgi:hypothetical protein
MGMGYAPEEDPVVETTPVTGQVTSAAGTVTLATAPPLAALIVPALDDGGEEVVITEAGTEVDAATAQRAHEAAAVAGFRLRIIT